MLADLSVEVEIFFGLHRGPRRVDNGFNPIEPFDRSRSNVSENNDAKWIAVDFGKWLAIHFPSKENFIEFDLRPGY